MMKKSHEEKAKYLQSLFDKIYLGDIIERNKILHDKSVLDDILNIISSSVGSLTNAGKLPEPFAANGKSTSAMRLSAGIWSFSWTPL